MSGGGYVMGPQTDPSQLGVMDSSAGAAGAGSDSFAQFVAMLKQYLDQQKASQGSPLAGMQEVAGAQKLSGVNTPSTADSPGTTNTQAALQGAAQRQALMKAMSNKADAGMYKGFDQSPQRYLPTIQKQEEDYANHLESARHDWQKHDTGGTEMPEYLRPDYGAGRTTDSLSNELEWHQQQQFDPAFRADLQRASRGLPVVDNYTATTPGSP